MDLALFFPCINLEKTGVNYNMPLLLFSLVKIKTSIFISSMYYMIKIYIFLYVLKHFRKLMKIFFISIFLADVLSLEALITVEDIKEALKDIKPSSMVKFMFETPNVKVSCFSLLFIIITNLK